MSSSELGKLVSTDLRKAWPQEAHDFTPWLAENLDRLSGVIGIELDLEGCEVQVGPYRADIVANEPADGTRVLIENQLEAANLQHLGQVLAYLAGLEAKIVVWIAKEFDEQHRSAIRWLNDHTDDPLAFFAVRIRVVQIGKSPLALSSRYWNAPTSGTAECKKARELGNSPESASSGATSGTTSRQSTRRRFDPTTQPPTFGTTLKGSS